MLKHVYEIIDVKRQRDTSSIVYYVLYNHKTGSRFGVFPELLKNYRAYLKPSGNIIKLLL